MDLNVKSKTISFYNKTQDTVFVTQEIAKVS
jgi:hypothetical protein